MTSTTAGPATAADVRAGDRVDVAAGGRVDVAADTVTDVWERFAHRLRGFIATRVSDPADAEDVLQEVFVKLQRSSSQLRDADRLTSWVFRIAQNTIIDHYRSAPRRREISADTSELAPTSPGADESLDDQSVVRAEIAACLRPLLEQLPEPSREALELVEFSGISQAQAARELGISVSGMKSRVQRARSRVRAHLDELCSIAVDARGGPIDCVPQRGGPCDVSGSPERSPADGTPPRCASVRGG